MLKDRIASLDDKAAVKIVQLMAKSLMKNETYETSPTPEIAAALQSAFQISPSPEKTSEGKIARVALQWLADDPEYAPRISAMIDGPAARNFPPEAVPMGMVVIGLLLLQPHVRFEKDKKGKTTILIEKKAASDKMLKTFIEKLPGWFNKK